MELDLWPRQHDLPPRWDNLPVEWGEWTATADIFVCPPLPKRPKCEHCGSQRNPQMALGRVWTEPGMVHAIRKARMQNGKHLVANLAAFRCPDCEHDHVFDFAKNATWTLDPTDYTDAGSYDITPPDNTRRTTRPTEPHTGH